MFGMSPMEMMMVFLVILLLFGAKRLPELARSMGKAIREFKGATEKITEELDVNSKEDASVKADIPQKDKKESNEE